MKKLKLQLLTSGLCCLAALFMLIGASFAYFSESKQITNTMTAGNVSIELTEAAVRSENGDLVEDTSKPRIKGGADVTVQDYGIIYPGISVFKDPTIQNVGNLDAWLAAKITVTDGDGEIYNAMGYPGHPGIDIRMLLGGGALEESTHFGQWNGIDNVRHNDKYAMVQTADVGQGVYSFYLFFLEPFAPEEQVVLFDNFSVPAEWTSEEMKEFSELTIHIQAYGVQVFELESCYEAMTKAFPTHFIVQ